MRPKHTYRNEHLPPPRHAHAVLDSLNVNLHADMHSSCIKPVQKDHNHKIKS